MYTFPTNLQNALDFPLTETYWLLRLFYNDDTVGTNWIGISDLNRTIGTDVYYGILNDPGGYFEAIDIFEFDANTGDMTISLINTPRSMSEHNRFSDLWATNNFANRKWILYQMAEGLADADKGQIGQGKISNIIGYDEKTFKLVLLDRTSEINKTIPTAIVTGYPNAPLRNVDLPIPVPFGDFDVDPNAPVANARFDRYHTKGKFPAIIVDKWDFTNGRVEARCDNQALDQVRTMNLFMILMGFFIACDENNVVDSNPILEYSGDTWRVYIPLSEKLPHADGVDWENTTDGDHTTYGRLRANGSNVVDHWRFPKVPNMGEIVTINFMINKEVTGTGPIPLVGDAFYIMVYSNNQGGAFPGDAYVLTWNDAEETLDITASYENGGNPDDKTSWNLEGRIELRSDDDGGGGGNEDCDVYKVGVEIEFKPNQLFEKKVQEMYEVMTGHSVIQKPWGSQIIAETVKRTRTKTIATPQIADYVYYSGKGRQYFAEIDTEGGDARNDINGDAPDPGYASGDLINNPIYQGEEMLRDQITLPGGSIDQDDIDLESFDYSGNATNGYIGQVFDMVVSNIKFAYSQYKFISMVDFLQKLGSQCGTIFYPSGSGKIRAFTLRKAADYSASDYTIDFNDVDLESEGIFETPENNVRNYIRVHYAYDYGEDQNTLWAEPGTNPDGVSDENGVTGINQQLNYIVEADFILDAATATALAQYLQDRFKFRFKGLVIRTKRAKYNKAERGDIVDFSNFPSDLKVYGATQSGYYVIANTEKFVDRCRITLLKVS